MEERSALAIGTRIEHPKFGNGVIIEDENKKVIGVLSDGEDPNCVE